MVSGDEGRWVGGALSSQLRGSGIVECRQNVRNFQKAWFCVSQRHREHFCRGRHQSFQARNLSKDTMFQFIQNASNQYVKNALI